MIRVPAKTNGSARCDWDLDHRYSLIAARVVRMLISVFMFENEPASETMPGLDFSDRRPTRFDLGFRNAQTGFIDRSIP